MTSFSEIGIHTPPTPNVNPPSAELNSSSAAKGNSSVSTISSGSEKARGSSCFWSIVWFPCNIVVKLLGAVICLVTCGRFCAEKLSPVQVRKELEKVQDKEQMAAFLKKHPAVKQDMIDRAIQKLVERNVEDPADAEAVTKWKKNNSEKVGKEKERIESLIKNFDPGFKTDYLKVFIEKPIDPEKLS